MPSVSLTKGGNISLTKPGGRLKKVVVACGWDANSKPLKSGLFSILGGGNEPAYDLDLSAAGLDSTNKVPSLIDPSDHESYQEWFIYANHRHPSNRSIVFHNDNRTGAGEGDDETIGVDLTEVDDNIVRILFSVVIWQAKERGGQKFGNVQNAFIRIYDEETGQEITRYDLGAEFSNETLVVFGELYRHNGEWKFRAIGQGYDAATYRQVYNIKRRFEFDYARYHH